MPGSRIIRSRAMPAAKARPAADGEVVGYLGGAVGVGGASCMVFGSPRMCMRTTAAPRRAARAAIAGSAARAETSLTMSAPASKAAPRRRPCAYRPKSARTTSRVSPLSRARRARAPRPRPRTRSRASSTRPRGRRSPRPPPPWRGLPPRPPGPSRRESRSRRSRASR
jgi:hypothetical protein